MNAPLPRQASSCCAICDAPLGLTPIFDPEIQLAQWRRPADTVIVDWLNEHADELGSGFRQVLPPGQIPDLGHWPPGSGRAALAADIALLAEILGDLLGAPSICLRLEVVGKAMCPRLHVDRVGIRLLCTYRGPGTEWEEDTSVDRRFLGVAVGGVPDDVSGLLPAGHQIEAIPTFAVALLKGSLWQGNNGRGIIHRSPAVGPSEAPRVLLAMDAGW
jgi:hypothetical protein